MTPEEANAVISQFEQQFPVAFRGRGVHGIVVSVVNGVPELHLWILPGTDRIHLSTGEIAPSTFDYKFNGVSKSLAVKEVTKSAVQGIASNEWNTATVSSPGDTASPSGADYYGTAGWNIIYMGIPVCVSNYHVLCPQGNDTPLNTTRISLAGQNIASLYLFQPVDFGGAPPYNVWDYALAAFDNEADAGTTMRPCDNGYVYPYPEILGSTANFGDTFYKVGARAPICREGKLTTVGTVFVNYDNLGNIGAWFNQQLIFDKMTDPGDSGAVIVSKSDNAVVGLNFAGNDDQTIANPIYQVDWFPVGFRELPNGHRLPMFERRVPR